MNFLWGVATSGHQTEGGNSDSDTWFAEHVTPTVFREPSGPACDGFHRWRDDLDLVAGMGLTAYRFSVEWARVEPVEGSFSAAALDHYAAIVNRCVELGLAPVVTFNHMTCPHWFAARGAWLDPASASLFARYCGVVMDRFGASISHAVTLNEPNLPRLLSWSPLPPEIRELERATLDAAGKAAGVHRYRLTNVVLPEEFDAMEEGQAVAHVAAREAIRSRRPDLPVGLSIAVVDDQAVGSADIRDHKRSEVYGRWLRSAAEDDFIGVQNYERARYDGDGPLPPPSGAVLNQLGSDIYPPSLGNAIRYVHAEAGVPVFVTEHGIATEDDTQRAAFLEPALAGLREAIDDGVPVLGYLHWTLLDNFEWIFGYGPKLGLVEVDRQSLARTPKASSAEYARIVRAASGP
ncbi:family 1 glycosylhydrolase [Actinoplanes sp. NBRC 103695]|uniref:glycoside hydrolase family 1 protein n=1 Tax=Actinoplanes sp. NBRC 103695 TaxID=3032202 RepID=UPI00249F9D1E|nr:family 1 glycosylhydrolase [Actinoplanes sp. NBRC 103695]GLY94476.1 beta-glucosidase [Actinoplanes sp. NBRC 103695]